MVLSTSSNRVAGISLVIGCFFMIVTMVLHPVGGDFEHLVQILTIGRISHIIAILSIPLVAYGFWGMNQRLNSSFANVGLSFMIFGLISVMLAGAVNGLILMDIVESYRDANQQTIDSLKPIFRLIRSINHAFDFIFIGAVCISTFIWSLVILKGGALPRLLGWLGILISIAAVIALVAGFVFVDLHGFRIFIFGWVAWVIGIGFRMISEKDKE